MEDEYGDDFEDYEDEFEADEPEDDPPPPPPAQAKVSPPRPPPEQENAYREKRSATAVAPLAERAPPRAQEPPARKVVAAAVSAPPARHFIAPPSQETMQLKQRKAARLAALRPKLQLRDVNITLYDAAPLTGYELYVRHQSRNMRTKAVQTRDDDVDVAIQTDEVETLDTLCQCPEDSGAGSVRLVASEGAKTQSLLSANVGRLRKFIKSAGQVVEALLSENTAGQSDGFSSANSLHFSTRHASIDLPSSFGARQPSALCFTPDTTAVLVAYTAAAEPIQPSRKRDAAEVGRLNGSGMLCVWKLHLTSFPWAVLRCLGTPSCCMLSPVKPYLAFAGTDEGAVQMWDLREAGSAHANVELHGESVALRSPTYCSDGLGMGAHSTPIREIREVPSLTDTSDLSIASLEMEGAIVIWLVLETDSTEPDMYDFGQAVGAHARLLKSNTVASATGSVPASAGLNGDGKAIAVLPTRYVCMSFVPNDPSRFVVGDDIGHSLHRSRYSEALLSPRSFDHHFDGSSAAVNSIAFCPSQPAYLLIGRADGSVNLYHVDDSQPLISWQGFSSGGVLQLAWATTRPSVFWVLDSCDYMHVFELLESIGKPSSSVLLRPSKPSLATDEDSPPPASEPKQMRFALDFAPPVDRGKDRRMLAATVKRHGLLGGIEVHVLNEKLAKPKKGEAAAFVSLLESL